MRVHELQSLLARANQQAVVRLMGVQGELFELENEMVWTDMQGPDQHGQEHRDCVINCTDLFLSPNKATMRLGFLSEDFVACPRCKGMGRVTAA